MLKKRTKIAGCNVLNFYELAKSSVILTYPKNFDRKSVLRRTLRYKFKERKTVFKGWLTFFLTFLCSTTFLINTSAWIDAKNVASCDKIRLMGNSLTVASKFLHPLPFLLAEESYETRWKLLEYASSDLPFSFSKLSPVLKCSADICIGAQLNFIQLLYERFATKPPL